MNVHDRAQKHVSSAGRMCPSDYRYAPAVFDRPHEFEAGILYVVGGLYGNLAALDAIEKLAAAERSRAEIVFNGDFHWFDAEARWFSDVADRVAGHRAIRGNVETEIARAGDIGAGCGCAYPESVDDGAVQRSNDILVQLRGAAGGLPQLAALPMHRVAKVGDARIGIVHGDAWSLAGWRFAHDALDDPAQRGAIAALRERTGIDVFASTHTCLAALRRFDTPRGALAVINNGAAGMPNFRDTAFGIVSRIAVSSSPHRPLYGTIVRGVHVDAIAVHYDKAAFLSRFLTRWPHGSPAHESYFGRIVKGPGYDIAQAAPLAMVAA